MLQQWLGPWRYRLVMREITCHSYTVAHVTDERYSQGFSYNFVNNICQLSNLQIYSKVLQILKVNGIQNPPSTFWMRSFSTSPDLEMGLDILAGVCLDVRDICTSVNVINIYSSCKPLNNLCLHMHSSSWFNVSWKSNSLIIFPVICRRIIAQGTKMGWLAGEKA